MKSKITVLATLLLLVMISACENGVNLGGEKPLFTLTDSNDTHFFFWNEIHETELLNVFNYGYFYQGAGVGIGDINNDGLPDVYMVGNSFGGRLFLNEGELKFKQITETSRTSCSGYTNGVTMADVNQDGYVDIYLSRSMASVDSQRANLLFINNRDNTFTERAKEYGIADRGYSMHANFFDYDKDGDLDLYVLNHTINFDNPYEIKTSEKKKQDLQNLSPKEYEQLVSKLYRNNGNGTFTDVTIQAGVRDAFFGLSATVGDVNNDGWPDLYCTSDFAEIDHLYLNNKNGTFTDGIYNSMGHIAKNTMGSDIADYNNDGLLDIVTLDMMAEDNYRSKQLKGNSPFDLFQMAIDYGYHCQVMRNCLQLNNGDGSFSEVGQLAGMSHTDWSWAPLLADFDNDGYKDLFISNGYPKNTTDMDYLKYKSSDVIREVGGKEKVKFMDLVNAMETTPIKNYIYKNRGDLVFDKKTDDWGLAEKAISNGAAYADLDLDGDLDLIVNNFNTPSFLYRNNAREHNSENAYISFKFKPEQYGQAQGTKISLRTDRGIQYQELTHNRGYLSSMLQGLHFGLGKNNTVQEIQITYPNGTIQSIKSPTLNKATTLDLNQGVVGRFESDNNKNEAIPMTEIVNAFSPNYVHAESDFIDFKDEPLLEQMYSNRGPYMSVGDVNADGMEDVYISGSAGVAASLYIQTASGTFKLKPMPAFASDYAFEDGQSVFIDADKNGTLDLYVTSGSNEVRVDSLYQNRLYLNDGKGSFVRSQNIPTILRNTLSVAKLDADGDGYDDLVVGASVKPKQFPIADPSYLLLNNDGTFTKTDLPIQGIVNDIAISDINNDQQADIILAGDWMPITVLINNKASFDNETEQYGFEKSNGMWNSVLVTDVNQDGLEDIVAGNRGLNDFFNCNEEKPATLYVADFDDNGETEAIVNYYYNDNVLYPKYSLDELLQQLPSWRGLFPRYEDYSIAQSKDIFKESKYDDMKTYYCHTFESSSFIRVGDEYKRQALPIQAQFSPIYALMNIKLLGANYILAAGNNKGVDVNTGQYDAGKGGLYTWQDNKWIYKSITQSVDLSGQVRALKLVNGTNKKLLALSNSGQLQAYKL